MVTAMSTLATVHVTSYDHCVMTGYVYNAHYDKSLSFQNGLELLRQMESLFDSLSFPRRFEDYRHFRDVPVSPAHKTRKERSLPLMNEKQQEDKATFVVHVQFRRNATWQGTIHWVDKDKRQAFRSELEMIRLIDEALGSSCDEPRVTWE